MHQQGWNFPLVMVLGILDIHVEKNKSKWLSHTKCKSKLKKYSDLHKIWWEKTYGKCFPDSALGKDFFFFNLSQKHRHRNKTDNWDWGKLKCLWTAKEENHGQTTWKLEEVFANNLYDKRLHLRICNELKQLNIKNIKDDSI